MNYRAEFVKAIKGLSHRHHAWKVFEDYCEMHALALAQPFMADLDKALWDRREARYLEIVRRYETSEVKKLCELGGLVTLALEETGEDVLGPAFEELELSSKWFGQFFTPQHVCRLIAEMTLDSRVESTIKEKGFITVQEPACGAGAMVIALAHAMKSRGLNYQHCLHVTAMDKSPVAAYMAFIQLSLLGVPAAVYIGNTLTLEMDDCLLTPLHHIGLWGFRLRRGEEAQGDASEVAATDSDVILPDGEQLEMFADGAA